MRDLINPSFLSISAILVLKFEDGSSIEVDVQTASLLLIVYESLDGSNKKKFEEKVYKSKKSFLELVDFAIFSSKQSTQNV